MPFQVFKTIDVGSIAAGGSKSGEWTADDEYILKRIYAIEVTESAVGLQFLDATLRIDNDVLTKDSVRLSLFEGYTNQVPEIDRKFGKGKTFYYSIENKHSSSSISVVLVLELHK